MFRGGNDYQDFSLLFKIIQDYSGLFKISILFLVVLSEEERLQFPGEYSMCPAVVVIIKIIHDYSKLFKIIRDYSRSQYSF